MGRAARWLLVGRLRRVGRVGQVGGVGRVRWVWRLRSAGMTTAEYAVGTLAAVAFAAVLLAV